MFGIPQLCQGVGKDRRTAELRRGIVNRRLAHHGVIQEGSSYFG